MADMNGGGRVVPDSVFGRGRPLVVLSDLSLAAWNTVATHRVATVTGIVQVTTVFEITETWTSGGGLTADFGYTFDPTSYSGGAVALASLLVSRFVSPAAAATTTVVNLSAFLIGTNANMVMLSQNIGYRINIAAALDGTLRTMIFWTPVSPGASIVAAAGGVL